MNLKMLLPFLMLATAVPASAADLNVSFDNVATKDGVIMIAVYNSKDDFLAPSGAVAYGRAIISSTSASYDFSGLPTGTYAISAFHDVDGDGKLAKNTFGAPKEPYGMSNNARGTFGPPSFEDAAFTLPDAGASIRIRLD